MGFLGYVDRHINKRVSSLRYCGTTLKAHAIAQELPCISRLWELCVDACGALWRSSS